MKGGGPSDDKIRSEIGRILNGYGVKDWGTVPFAAFREHLIPCSGVKRLPAEASTILVGVFPYRADTVTGEQKEALTEGNISRYARAQDYHRVVGGMLSGACAALSKRFGSYQFEPFCDASPIPEVTAACMAGLGVRGVNGLLITPHYGSYVFIGEIVTDLKLDCEQGAEKSCLHCGRCLSACPGGALGSGGFTKERCASHLTQKKGKLDLHEAEIIAKAGSAWGCDICQKVCPMNEGRKGTEIAAFREDLIANLTPEMLARPDFEKEEQDRAFLWRGIEILKRNLRILADEPADNRNENL